MPVSTQPEKVCHLNFFNMYKVRDYSKLDLLPLFGVVKIFLELELKITGLGNSNFI